MRTRIGCHASVPCIFWTPIAGHRRDDPVGVHLSDAVIVAIRNEEVALSVHRHRLGMPQTGSGCWTTVARVDALLAVAGHSCDDPIDVHLAHAIVALVREIQIARAVYCHSGRKIERGFGCGTAVAGESERAAGDRAQHSGFIQLVDGGSIQI